MQRDNYAAWDVKESDFPKDGTMEEKIKFFLRYGILAPSTHNTQPWLFEIKGNTVKVFPNWYLRLPEADPTDKNLWISLGCCVTNICCASGYFNYDTKVNINENNIVISFFKNKSMDNNLSKLFPFILKRWSNKNKYLPKEINKEYIEKIEKIGSTEKVTCKIFYDRGNIEEISRIHSTAAGSFAHKKGFRLELSSYMRTSTDSNYDGMPGFVSGLSDFKVRFGKIINEYTPLIILSHKNKDKTLINSSSAVGFLIAGDNNIKTGVEVGFSYEKIALLASSLSIDSTIMVAMIENTESLKHIKDKLGFRDKFPMIFFRLGYSNEEVKHSPRRKIEDLIIK